MSNSVTLSSPWVDEARKIYMIFREDTDVTIVYDETNGPEVKLYVSGQDKADSIQKILPTEKTFGNVTLKITVIPNNSDDTIIDIFKKAFANNPIVDEIIIDDNPSAFCANHVVFRNEVVQYFNDNLNDAYGLQSILFEDLARDVFVNTDGVFFNTAPNNNVTIWP